MNINCLLSLEGLVAVPRPAELCAVIEVACRTCQYSSGRVHSLHYAPERMDFWIGTMSALSTFDSGTISTRSHRLES